jgi:hypothetical protein
VVVAGALVAVVTLGATVTVVGVAAVVGDSKVVVGPTPVDGGWDVAGVVLVEGVWSLVELFLRTRIRTTTPTTTRRATTAAVTHLPGPCLSGR